MKWNSRQKINLNSMKSWHTCFVFWRSRVRIKAYRSDIPTQALCGFHRLPWEFLPFLRFQSSNHSALRNTRNWREPLKNPRINHSWNFIVPVTPQNGAGVFWNYFYPFLHSFQESALLTHRHAPHWNATHSTPIARGLINHNCLRVCRNFRLNNLRSFFFPNSGKPLVSRLIQRWNCTWGPTV